MSDEHPPSRMTRAAALAGVAGPAAFVGSWCLGAALTDANYSSVDDAISRLASVGSDVQPIMTFGFIAFGVALPVYSTALRRVLPGYAWCTAALTGASTLLVAATPLDHSSTVDKLHGAFAAAGYVTLAATPLLAVGPLRARGALTLARIGLAAGVVSAVSLALTTTGLPNGLFQRIGLTVADAWIALSAIAIAAARIPREHCGADTMPR